ncbi:hypothetical protein HZB60_09350 [candidate division KSB1 bacterium]|nr:hypothetical protein [candidate division KSB1 bacterium]
MKVYTGFLFLAAMMVNWVSMSFAQAPDSLWTRAIGGPGYDEAEAVQQTSDGGFIVGGLTMSYGAGNEDFWLVQLDADGDTLWTNHFGGNHLDRCYSVIQTNDGGFAMAGYTETFGAGSSDFWLVKTNANGDSLWSRTYGGAAIDICYMVIETGDLGFALVGRSTSYSGAGDSDFYLVKTDANGNPQWSRRYGGAGFDLGWCVLQTPDGGYALAGRTQSYGAGNEDFWLVKTNSTGDSLWSHTYGGTQLDRCYVVEATNDGGYALGGHTFSFGAGSADYWLVKTDANGDSLWSRRYGGADLDAGYFMRETGDNGFVLTGASYSFGPPNANMWIVKTAANGDSLWSVSYGGGLQDAGYWIEQNSDGGYICAGGTASFGGGSTEMYVVRLDAEGPVFVPQQVVVQPFGGTDLRLVWERDGNPYYRVYRDSDPEGAFSTLVTTTPDTSVVLINGVTALKNFYIVKGSRIP